MPAAFRGKFVRDPNGHPLPPVAAPASRRRAPLWSQKQGFAERNLACVTSATHAEDSAQRKFASATGRDRCVHFCAQGAEQNRLFPRHACDGNGPGCIIVLSRPYFTRQAATLLKFAKLTSNPALAASLVERAADIKAQIDSDRRPDAGAVAPDVETEK